MERDLVRLAAEVKQGFEALRREMETDRHTDQRRHEENSHRLDLINGRVGRAHDRVSAVEATVGSLRERIENIGTRTHQRMNEVQEWIAKIYGQANGDRNGDGDADKDVITGSRLKWAIWIFVGGFGVCVALMKTLGKL